MLHICPKLFGYKQNVNKIKLAFSDVNRTIFGNVMGTTMKTACYSRLRQIIAHVAVGASADACDKNIIQVRFSSHQCVPGAISGTVFIGM